MVIPAPGQPTWRLVIGSPDEPAQLEKQSYDGERWVPVWPGVPRPGRLILTGPERTGQYEFTWRGRRYLARRRELRRALALAPGQLPGANTSEGRALRRVIIAACERRPSTCQVCPGRPGCL